MTTAESPLPVPVPVINPETRHFWESANNGNLVLKRCAQCDAVIWYPREICPVCHSTRTDWFDASGEGQIYTFTVVRRSGGVYAKAVPFVLAYVELDEGPKVVTNIVDCDPESVQIGQRVTAVFPKGEEGQALVRFRPVDASPDVS